MTNVEIRYTQSDMHALKNFIKKKSDSFSIVVIRIRRYEGGIIVVSNGAMYIRCDGLVLKEYGGTSAVLSFFLGKKEIGFIFMRKAKYEDEVLE